MKDSVNIKLRSQAIGLGLCEQWQKEWHDNLNYSELIDKFIRGQDFCIRHNFPSLDFIKQHFPKAVLRMNNIFLDEDVEITPGSGSFFLLGSTKARMRIRQWEAATIWVRHKSEIEIEAEQGSIISIRLFNNSKVTINRKENSHVSVIDNRN